MELTKEDWAKRQLSAQGNGNPSPESIQFYVDILNKVEDESTMDSQDQEFRKWVREMYERDVKNFSQGFLKRRKMVKDRKKQQKRRK